MSKEGMSRRDLLGLFGRGAGAVALGGVLGGLLANSRTFAHGGAYWQIDPKKCTQCGKCATDCVINPSAVKCFHAFGICGYCDLCFGYFETEMISRDTAAENQLCPTGAILRKYVEDPYYEYDIDRDLCVGCARCVKGCVLYGNGSLHLQIDQKLCEHCNNCSIAAVCPAGAIERVSMNKPYVPPRVKGAEEPGEKK